MVAKAGSARGRHRFLDVADRDITFTVNARGTFLCYNYTVKQMVAQGRVGRHRRVLGCWETRIRNVDVQGLTQAAASNHGKRGITASTCALGAVETPMSTTLLSGSAC
ncbi:hypothetical protein B0H10DRAFT_2078177 [Mycena sp. CBHHK59/15]|nr:hypothetical protein B0H10DRAFT_2078177 [Mycena sp. CBHHK59/15]